MNLDGLDLEIFLCFLNNGCGEHTIVDITKSLFGEQNRDDMIKNASKLNYRMKKWVDKGFLNLKKDNGIKKYSINMRSIFFENNCILLGKSHTINMGKALIFEMTDNSYFIHFLK